jgi:hypothetical protein
MQHSDKHTCNIRLKTQMRHCGQTLTTYVYNHCNICNIFDLLLQNPYETIGPYIYTFQRFEHLTYTRSMYFQCNISLLLGRMEARRCDGGSGRTTGRGQPCAAPSCWSAWWSSLRSSRSPRPMTSNAQRRKRRMYPVAAGV